MSDRLRPLPADVDGERALLGALLLGPPEQLAAVRATVSAEDFHRAAHALVFAELCTMADEGAPLEPVALLARLSEAGRLEDAGGAGYVSGLGDQAPSGESAPYYARRVRDVADQRRAILAALDLEARARAGDIAPELALGAAALSWAPPIPLGEARALPSFPVDALPHPFGGFVDALAVATQTPPDLAGLLTLAALATVAGGRGRIEGGPGWTEPLNLYAAVALPPANRKSEVFRRILAPIRALEGEAAARAAPELARAATDRELLEDRLKDARARATKAPPERRAAAEDEARELAAELAALAVPVAPRWLCDDVSPEKLAGLLAAQGGRIALWSEEGGPFEIMAGRYSSKGEPRLEVFLKGHDGGALLVDRIGRPPERVDRPALTFGLAVQPHVLAGLARRDGFRERGLLGRFLYALPASLVGRRAIAPPPVPASVEAGYAAAIGALLDREPGEGALLTLEPGAARMLSGFLLDLEPRLHPEAGDLGAVADWAGKLAGHVLRLAGLLHLAAHAHARDPWAPPVSPDTLRDAIRLGDYLIPHALAVFGLMGADPARDDARRVLSWLDRARRPAFVARDAFNELRGSIPTMERLRPALRLLEDHGFIRLRPTPPRPGPGRKPSPAFEVNPLWCAP